MEYGDIGIKTAEDVIEAIGAGASASELLAAYGDRIAGLIAAALDEVIRTCECQAPMPIAIAPTVTDPSAFIVGDVVDVVALARESYPDHSSGPLADCDCGACTAARALDAKLAAAIEKAKIS